MWAKPNNLTYIWILDLLDDLSLQPRPGRDTHELGMPRHFPISPVYGIATFPQLRCQYLAHVNRYYGMAFDGEVKLFHPH